MLTEEQALKAIEWLKDNARTMAQARAERIYMEQWIKTVKAECMRASAGNSVAAAEMEALTTPKYLSALQAYRESIETDENYRFLSKAAEAQYEAWRTMSANERAG